MPPTQTLGPRAKKAQKCVFFIAELSKIIGPKNKKLQNSVSFLFYIHVTREKSTTYAKFGKNLENHLKYFFQRRRVYKTPQKYYHSMRLNQFYLLYIHIGRHKYARSRTIFDFMTELKFQKNSNLISRRPRGDMTSDQKIKL